MATQLPLPHLSQFPHRQLELPTEHDLPQPSPHRPLVCPHHLWEELSPTDQVRIRQTLIRIMQEVVHDAHDWSENADVDHC